MTLQELIKTLQQIALTQPNVRTATDGDIYEVMNGNPSVRYGVFHITQNTHQSYEDRDVYGLNLFYVDRNEEDNTNTLQIQSIGKSVIDNIVRTFVEEFDGEYPTINYTPFTQRFKDDTAGVFAGISMEVYKDWICPDTYGEYVTDMNVVRNQNKTIKITVSGIYTVVPDEGYTGLGEVIVDTELANTVQDVKSIEITENGEYAVVADSPFLSIGKVDIDVNLPLQEKKEMTVTDNGTYEVMADEGYVGMKTAEITVEYTPKKQLPNGMRLPNSTFTEFDMTLYDWSMVYDCAEMFSGCRQLTTLTTAPIRPLVTSRMFTSCNNLTKLDLSNWDLSRVTDANKMFIYCSSLVELRMGGPVDSLKNAENMFSYASTTGTFYYPAQYDYSKIIAELPSKWTAVPY